MHIGDQCLTFKQLPQEGHSPAAIAVRFSISEQAVRRALKLANVSERLLALFRDDDMSYEQVCALALSDDPDQQERLWFGAASDWQRTQAQLRACITQEELRVDGSPIVAFVGLTEYEAAGGHVRRDLFATDQTGWIADRELLNRLAMEKLTAATVEVGAEGWQWVASAIKREHTDTAGCRHLEPERRAFTRKEERELAKLEKTRDAARDALNAYYDDEEGEQDDEKHDALQDALDVAEADVMAYEQRAEYWSYEQKAQAGAYVTLDYAGNLVIERGLVKPQPRDTMGDPCAHDPDPSGPAAKVKPLHSESLCERLTAHRTAAAQAALIGAPRVAVAYTLAAMIERVFDEHFTAYHSAHALDMTFSPTLDKLPRAADDLLGSPAWQAIDAQRLHWLSVLPTKKRDLFPWLLSADEATTANLFAFCVAAHVDGRPEPDGQSARGKFAAGRARSRYDRVLEADAGALFGARIEAADCGRGDAGRRHRGGGTACEDEEGRGGGRSGTASDRQRLVAGSADEPRAVAVVGRRRRRRRKLGRRFFLTTNRRAVPAGPLALPHGPRIDAASQNGQVIPGRFPFGRNRRLDPPHLRLRRHGRRPAA
ncbi:chromosome partitioning protein ParB [Burkholderia diffusa]|uniref:chromosome partitioning protein ParB n=1 Tax=Burkholderia diffusa TaxID=488732 RepID=UPI000AC8B976|nr:chromosome partitioning protein ParB [Burkholderia diffusa]